MRAGLFDVLIGRFADGTPVGGGTDPVRSVVSHLGYLFNSRRGALPHLPDYGLPDVSEIYRDLPDSIDPLSSELRRIIERYEPRLARVRVEHVETDPFAMRLTFLVTGETTTGAAVRLETTFSSNDPARVLAARP